MNFRQLYTFQTVARQGSIVRAAEVLHLTPQAVSGQLSELEQQLKVALFERRGRRLQLTEAGKTALAHADEIFQLGQQLVAELHQPAGETQRPFRVGIADVIPKTIAYRLLAPVLELSASIRLICHEDKLEALFADLAVHRLDLVIADRPMPAEYQIRANSRLLGQSTLELMASESLWRTYQPRFPAQLDGAPFLLPGKQAALRAPLERWLNQHAPAARIVGEFDDLALMKAFGQQGSGLFPLPTAIADEVSRQYQVRTIGTLPALTVSYHAITAPRHQPHPAITAIEAAADILLTRSSR